MDYIPHTTHFIPVICLFCVGSLYLLIYLTCFFPSWPLLTSGNHLLVLFIYNYLFICFVFWDSTYK